MCLFLIKKIVCHLIFFLINDLIIYRTSNKQPEVITQIYLLKVNNRNSRTKCEICSKLSIMLLERRHWRRLGDFNVNFGHISHLVLVFLLLTMNICNCRLGDTKSNSGSVKVNRSQSR